MLRCAGCGANFSPIDQELGVAPGRDLTPSLVRRVAWGAATHSLGDASRDLLEYLDMAVSPAECERIYLEEGARLDRLQRADDERRLLPADARHPAPAPEMACQRLIIEADATCVLTVKGEEHKSVYCGRAFDALARVEKESGRREIVESRYTGSAVNMEDFGQRMKALAWRAGMRTAGEVAFVADGAACLWRWAEDALPAGTVLIQDYWHVSEHLAELARDVFGEAGSEAIHAAWAGLLYEGGVDELIEQLRLLRQNRRGRARRRLDEETGYLEKGRERMRYGRFREAGWPIGSGAIEGTCKHLIKERFCLTGAHWRRANLPAMLALRLAIFNGQWEEAWQMPQAA